MQFGLAGDNIGFYVFNLIVDLFEGVVRVGAFSYFVAVGDVDVVEG